jgi:hypothetical protein
MAGGLFGKQKLTQLLLTPDESVDHKVGEDHRGDTKHGQNEDQKLSLRRPVVQANVLEEII